MLRDEAAQEEETEPRVWSWGAGTDGQLATGAFEDEHVPRRLPNFPSAAPISTIACGGAHAIALTGDGKVLTWGRGTCGQLGHGEMRNCSQPKLVKFLENFTVSYVSAGWNHSGYVTGDGHLFMCGDGSFGQLGSGDYKSLAFPLEVPFFVSKHVEQIACGMRHSLVLLRGPLGESIYGFGSGRRGQIGFLEGKSRSSNLPKAVDGFVNCEIVYICANGDHSAALSANGQLYTWGRGFSGSTDDNYPRTCPSSLRFSQVALGWNHALLIGDDHVYMLGGGHHGMLSGSQQANLEQQTSLLTAACSRSDVIGESSRSKLLPESSFNPTLQRVPCLEEEKIACIAAGAEHSAIVTEKGMIMTWGWGEHGQLGLGKTDDQTCPQTVNLMSTSCVRIRVYCGSGFTFVSSM